MEKQQRHRLIARIIAAGNLRNQEQLRERLDEEGVRSTQGTLSRDLRELGVVKGPRGYTMPTTPSHRSDAELAAAISKSVKRIELAGTLVVIHTEAGYAQALAVQLDGAPPDGVVGTLAGDDTIFIATRSGRDAAAVLRTLSRMGRFK